MPCPSRAQLRHILVASVALSALFGAVPAAAEIFKCVAKDGSVLYQNFPCDIDSLGLPSSPPAGKPSSANGQEKPTAALVSVASTIKSAGDPRIGMTADEVRALLGEPETVEEDEPGSGGRVSTWRYPDGRIVQFNYKHRVTGVQR